MTSWEEDAGNRAREEEVAGSIEKPRTGSSPLSRRMKGLRPREGETLAPGPTAARCGETPGLSTAMPVRALYFPWLMIP